VYTASQMPSEFEMRTITVYAETDINAYKCKFDVIQICHLSKKKSLQIIRRLWQGLFFI